MAKRKPLVSIIILSYNSRRFIEGCLMSVFAQNYRKIEVLVVVTGNDDGSKELIEKKYGRRKKLSIVDPGENLWFAKGNNLGIRKTQGEYVMALNQDTIMERDVISKLVNAMEEDEQAASCTAKLMHYKFDIDSKTSIIDSTGIEVYKSRKIIDRGQWEVDRHQYDEDTEVFGASGAGAFYRRSALEEVRLLKADGEYEYFDEDFVAYQEDIDLAWRLQLRGYTCLYIPDAIIHHGRTVGRSWPSKVIHFIMTRRKLPRRIRRYNVRNHHFTMLKNELPEFFFRHFFYIFVREFLMLIYLIIFEPFQYRSIVEIVKLWGKMRQKRERIMEDVKVDKERFLKLFA